ncbi:MAG: 50S ribosomal protein L18 [Defluviitaleaceae bacterium]|nr:50S ribosomal protein L18 [Defluviitaleaceae bacterium]
MIKKPSRNVLRKKRHLRIRNKISGTLAAPRLCVFRSNKHIYAQVIDDISGHTLAAANTKEAGLNLAKTGNVDAAKTIGSTIAKRAIAAGHSKIVFDRGGYVYHGKVKALADAAREAGLQF